VATHSIRHSPLHFPSHASPCAITFQRQSTSLLIVNGRVHLNRRGASVQSTAGNRGVRISGSNVGYTMFRGSVKGSGYPLHSPVSPSIPLPCVTVCHHISTGVYFLTDCKRTSPFKSAGASVQSTAGSRGVRISSSNAGYTMFRGSVKGTGYPLHSPVFPSIPLSCHRVQSHFNRSLPHRMSYETLIVMV